MKKQQHSFDPTVIIYEGAKVHPSIEIGPFTIIYPNVEINEGVRIASSAIIGKNPSAGKNQVALLAVENKTTIEKDVFVGDQAIIYAGSSIGEGSYLADKCLIRENVILDKKVVIGTMTVVSFNAVIGEGSKVMTASNICGNMTIGKNVFVGVHVCSVTDNNPQALSKREDHAGPVIEDDCFIGSNATLLPGVKVSKAITVASGSVVTKNLDIEESFYLGSPAKFLKSK